MKMCEWFCKRMHNPRAYKIWTSVFFKIKQKIAMNIIIGFWMWAITNSYDIVVLSRKCIMQLWWTVIDWKSKQSNCRQGTNYILKMSHFFCDSSARDWFFFSPPINLDDIPILRDLCCKTNKFYSVVYLWILNWFLFFSFLR